jgi:hypothetical protein
MTSHFSFITFDHTGIEKLGRAEGKSVVVTAKGNAERGTDGELYGTHGVVSRASKKTRGVKIRIGKLSIIIGAYTYGVEPPDNEGALKLYATDADGNEKGSHLLDSDGTHVINNGTDWAVRYSALETAFTQLRADHNKLAASYDAHTHGGVTSGLSSTGTTVPSGAESSADIEPSKVEEVRLP